MTWGLINTDENGGANTEVALRNGLLDTVVLFPAIDLSGSING